MSEPVSLSFNYLPLGINYLPLSSFIITVNKPPRGVLILKVMPIPSKALPILDRPMKQERKSEQCLLKMSGRYEPLLPFVPEEYVLYLYL